MPFCNPKTFRVGSLATATSFGALTYLGFDSVTTLAEDVHNPRQNVLRATVLVCAFTGVFGGLLVYLAQIVWPVVPEVRREPAAFQPSHEKVLRWCRIWNNGAVVYDHGRGAGRRSAETAQFQPALCVRRST